MTRNDMFRLHNWKQFYEVYKDEIYKHIVVDNGSSEEYLNELKKTFKDSTIIEMGYNGGCTGAYNTGIRFALTDPEIDAIALIGNDVKIEKGGLTKLYRLLYSKPNYGMVGPVLLKKDSELIENFGYSLSSLTGLTKILHIHQNISGLKGKTIEVDYVSGGANISKRSFYEEAGVGLQDNNLFMYGDERNMALRAARKGYKEIVTSDVLAWHQHINKPNKEGKNQENRNALVGYLIPRNFIYTHKMFYNRSVTYIVVVYLLIKASAVFLKNIFKRPRRQYFYNYLKGIKAGLKGDMDNSYFQNNM